MFYFSQDGGLLKSATIILISIHFEKIRYFWWRYLDFWGYLISKGCDADTNDARMNQLGVLITEIVPTSNKNILKSDSPTLI